MRHFRKSSISSDENYRGEHSFEHWYRNNSVYFLTARVRGGAHAFATEAAKQIFWDCFEKYSAMFGFVP